MRPRSMSPILLSFLEFASLERQFSEEVQSLVRVAAAKGFIDDALQERRIARGPPLLQ